MSSERGHTAQMDRRLEGLDRQLANIAGAIGAPLRASAFTMCRQRRYCVCARARARARVTAPLRLRPCILERETQIEGAGGGGGGGGRVRGGGEGGGGREGGGGEREGGRGPRVGGREGERPSCRSRSLGIAHPRRAMCDSRRWPSLGTTHVPRVRMSGSADRIAVGKREPFRSPFCSRTL